MYEHIHSHGFWLRLVEVFWWKRKHGGILAALLDFCIHANIPYVQRLGWKSLATLGESSHEAYGYVRTFHTQEVAIHIAIGEMPSMSSVNM